MVEAGLPIQLCATHGATIIHHQMISCHSQHEKSSEHQKVMFTWHLTCTLWCIAMPPPPPFKLMLQWCRLTEAAKFPAMGITSEDAPRRPTENSELMAPARMTGSWKLRCFHYFPSNISKHMQSRKWYLLLLLKDGEPSYVLSTEDGTTCLASFAKLFLQCHPNKTRLTLTSNCYTPKIPVKNCCQDSSWKRTSTTCWFCPWSVQTNRSAIVPASSYAVGPGRAYVIQEKGRSSQLFRGICSCFQGWQKTCWWSFLMTSKSRLISFKFKDDIFPFLVEKRGATLIKCQKNSLVHLLYLPTKSI